MSSTAMVDVDAGKRGLERGKSFVLVSQPLSNRLVHFNIVLKWGKCECFEMFLSDNPPRKSEA